MFGCLPEYLLLSLLVGTHKVRSVFKDLACEALVILALTYSCQTAGLSDRDR